MTSLIVHTLLATTWHTSGALLWYGQQFRNQGIDTVLYIPWMMRLLSNKSRVWGMSYWVEVCITGWPVHNTDPFIINRKIKDIRAVWAHALSCIKMNASTIAPVYGLTRGSRISLVTMYCCRHMTSSKHIQICTTIQGYLRPDHYEPPSHRSTSTMLESA